ncbi:MAG: ribosome maturation factor RimM [Bacteroidetes bacterium]|nr:ribosome maturation factor RimM [Bacteroidota bacterium]
MENAAKIPVNQKDTKVIDRDSCFLAGQVTKCSGYQGEVVIVTRGNFPVEYTELKYVFIEIDDDLIPFFIEEIDYQGKAGLRVKFLDVPDLERAKRLVNCPVFLPNEVTSGPLKDNPLAETVTGFEVTDINLGPVGVVDHILENTNQDLLVVKSPDGEILIPIVAEIILKIDKKKKRITVDLPEGLVNLNF